MDPVTYKIGDATVTRGRNWVHTSFPDGTDVHAHPGSTREDWARALSLGYALHEHPVVAMTRDHDIAHSLLAACRGQDRSPALANVAHGLVEDADDEERIVLLLQRVANVGLEGVLKDYVQRET